MSLFELVSVSDDQEDICIDASDNNNNNNNNNEAGDLCMLSRKKRMPY